MSAERPGLNALAESIADGSPVDWEQAERAAAPADLPIVRHLRLVSDVADLYRSLPPVPGSTSASAGVEPEGARWGHLIITELLGRGMSGEVHRAWDLELQRDVALKLFPADPRMGPRAQAEILSEARRLARVRHRNVATVHGADRDGDRVGFWMELVDGASLEHLLDRDGPFGAREAALIGIELCGALAAVHGAGLLHRDIKAQNVLRETGGRIVLTDFGTGEEAGTSFTRMAGTPVYLAPEILAGKPATIQTDLYSLGVLLFHLVTREFPIQARTMQDLVQAHKTGAVRHLRDRRPDLPSAFVEVVERLLAPDPAARFKTAGALESALRSTIDVSVALRQPGWGASLTPRALVGMALLFVMTVALVWSVVRWGGQATTPPSDPQSIAILPLADLTGGAGPPYLAEALTDQLIATVGQVQGLRVTSRTSVMALDRSNERLAETARRLGVGSVLEGTVALAAATPGSPARVRLNVRLIAAGSDTQLWSGTFERPLGDSFALQAELVQAIAREVRVAITPSEAARLERRQATSAAAEAAWFEGRHHLNQYGAASASKALTAFERAAALDVNYGAAYVGMARSYVRLGLDGAILHAEARARALALSQRALELDDQSAEAHAALADVTFYYDWNWSRAEQSYERALDLNPSSSEVRQLFARYLSAMGRLDEAVQQSQRATEVDPLSAEAAQVHGLMLYYARRYDDAAGVLDRAYALKPGSAGTHVILSRVREAQTRFDDALAEARKALAIAEHPGVRAHAARQMALAGDHAAARAELQRVTDGELRAHPEHVAYARLALGETERALVLLEQAEAERQPPILWMAVDPRLETLRGNERFRALITRIGLPPSSLDHWQARH